MRNGSGLVALDEVFIVERVRNINTPAVKSRNLKRPQTKLGKLPSPTSTIFPFDEIYRYKLDEPTQNSSLNVPEPQRKWQSSHMIRPSRTSTASSDKSRTSTPSEKKKVRTDSSLWTKRAQTPAINTKTINTIQRHSPKKSMRNVVHVWSEIPAKIDNDISGRAI
jgi:hypothetical protein